MNIQTGDEAVSRHAGHELHGRARQARHPAAQHGRRDVHQPLRGCRRRPRVEPGLRRRRGVLVLSERQHRRVLGADRDAGPAAATTTATRRKFDYAGRSLRRARRVPEGRRQLQSRSRLPAPRRLQALVRPAALQPAPANMPPRAQVHVGGQPRVPRQRRRRARDASIRPGASTPSSRTATSSRSRPIDNYEMLLDAVHAGARRQCSPSAATTFSDVSVSLHVGSAAAGLRHLVAAARRLLRRRHHDGRVQQRPRVGDQAFFARAGFSINRVDLPAGAFTTACLAVTRRLRLFAADVRQRAAAIQLERQHLQQQPALPLGVPPGSEFFVVWTDEQDTRPNGMGLRNRAFVLKITRLLRF